MTYRNVSIPAGIDIVSFDIFDTLLVRPYTQPVDLFMHMERAYNMPGFYNARIHAEEIARRNAKTHDITITQIYAHLDPSFKSMLRRELEWERMVLRPNPNILPLWNAAKKNGKRIIITSDMYLPSDFLADVLKQNGFDGYDALFVSCETNTIKSDGSMYEHVLEKYNIPAKRICHIGDNRHSDYKMARKYGLRAIHTPKIIEQYLKNNQRAATFFDKTCNDLDAHILIAIMAYRYATKTEGNHNYWYNLGYEYAGPAAYAYTRWIQETARQHNLDNIIFVARDGYTLQRVFDTFENKIKTNYVYAPRYLNLIYRLNYRTDNSDVAHAQQRTIINHYTACNDDFAKLVSKTDFTHETMAQFLARNYDILKPLATKNFETYKKYIKSILGKSTHPAIVDSITENFSAQLFISNALPGNVKSFGMYWHTINQTNIVPRDTYAAFIKNSKKRITRWNFMEFLFTSPEFPIEGIDNTGAPIYKQNVSDYERQIRAVYPDISNGATDFANMVKNWFGGHDIYLTYDTVTTWINNFIDNPYHMDRRYISMIQTATSPNNDTYESLMGDHISLQFLIAHPFKSLRIAKDAYWRTPLQTLAVCIFDPIKIHMRGIKKIEIILFPKLHSKYFSIGLSIVKYKYSFQIGTQDED